VSLHEYEMSRLIDAEQYPFYVLIMAAMRRADNVNERILRASYPNVWNELEARYNAPGGLLASERV